MLYNDKEYTMFHEYLSSGDKYQLYRLLLIYIVYLTFIWPIGN